jgi:hypothetical protein
MILPDLVELVEPLFLNYHVSTHALCLSTFIVCLYSPLHILAVVS